MSVQRDDDGKRSVQVEVEVPGSPEEVWRAIATAGGISSWFVPTRSVEGADGVPTEIISNFGPGMDSYSTVITWDPPNLLAAESKDLGPDGPTIATQWIVEARAGGTCVVRVVHSLFASTDDWDAQLEGWESGWPSFFRLLRLYLAHFSGQPSAAFQLMGFSSESCEAAWRKLLDGLGVSEVVVGGRVASSGAAPRLSGAVEHVGGSSHPEELLLRLETPAPGIAHLFAMEMGGQVVLSIRPYLYGEGAAGIAQQEEPVWQAWLGRVFPSG